MDLRRLEYFLEIAKYVSFSKAGKSLHISQPTLSKMIKTLEDELSIKLFDRSMRTIKLTDAGLAFQRHAQLILQAVGNLHDALDEIREAKRGSFSLGLPPVIGSSFFPDIIADFRKRFPLVDMKLVEEGGKTVERFVMEGQLDLGIVVFPVDPEQYEYVPLFERQLQLVVHSAHPLAYKREVTLGELREEPMIMFRRGFALYDRVKEACILQGFEPNTVFESTQWDFMCELVSAGLGIAFLPETVCEKLDPLRCKVVPSVHPPIRWDVGIIWRRDNPLSYASREWVRFITQRFKEPLS